MLDKELKVLVFNIDDELYATGIVDVERILGYEQTTKLPDSPEFITGVINYEGDILPIVSLAKKFKLENQDVNPNSKIIVAKQEENKIGIIVDSVSEVRDVKESDIEKPPEIANGVSKRYIKGLIKLDNKIIIFLNLKTILTDEEKRSL